MANTVTLFWLMLQGNETYIEGPSLAANLLVEPGQPRKQVCCSSPVRERLELIQANMLSAGRAVARK
jgi:hypothetical protein